MTRIYFSGMIVVALIAISFLPIQKPASGPTTRPLLCASPESKEAIKKMDTTRQMAPLLDGLGSYTMEVTSSSAEAKKFFNQGLNLYYGFNHLEAFRSFKEAARQDPNFAMAYWGQALSLGPNINLAMDPADATVVYEAVVKAMSKLQSVSEKERMLIEAVASRYTKDAPADRSPLDQAYASSMKKVMAQFPNDADVVALYAEALMDLHPWDYWLKGGAAQPWTAEILRTIETALRLSPNHPGANHFYIHAYEASSSPEKATASADLLRDLLPGAGHLVHMPSHIYIRTGRYEDGVITNLNAIDTDEKYLKQCKAEGFYPLVLYPHNIHFLWASATLDGQGAQAIKAADLLATKQTTELLLQPAWSSLQHFQATPYYARVRFGKWDEILRLERPDSRFKYTTAIWRYARAIAFVKKNKLDQAKAEWSDLVALVNDPAVAQEKILGINPMVMVLQIAQKVVEGELAAATQNFPAAIDALKAAMKIEDELLYQEPYDWHHPVRQILGDVLLQSGDAVQAEKYYREDLLMFANNGWSLTGLQLALEKQGKSNEARQIEAARKKSFARADIKIQRAHF